MDLVTKAIWAAVQLGVDKLSGPAASDAYAYLKAAIRRRLGNSGGRVVESIERLERKPRREGRLSDLEADVQETGGSKDPEVLAAAGRLLELLPNGPGGDIVLGSMEVGDGSAVVVGHRSTAMARGSSSSNIHIPREGKPPGE